MAYQHNGFTLGLPDLLATNTDQRAVIGLRTKGIDPVYGEGEFIFLKGVANTIVGSAVIYDEAANTTTLTVAGSRGPLAIAMSANIAGQYGWYQIAGIAVVKAAAAIANNSSPYVTASAGQLDDAVVATDKIDGMRFKTADGTPSAGFVLAQLDRPALNGNG